MRRCSAGENRSHLIELMKQSAGHRILGGYLDESFHLAVTPTLGYNRPCQHSLPELCWELRVPTFPTLSKGENSRLIWATIRLARWRYLLILQAQMKQAAFVVALPGPGLVPPSPPRPGQDEIRHLLFRPYQAGEQSAHLRGLQGYQRFIRTVAAPFSPCSIA